MHVYIIQMIDRETKEVSFLIDPVINKVKVYLDKQDALTACSILRDIRPEDNVILVHREIESPIEQSE